MSTGDNQLAIDAAVPPANPSRERMAAAVQLGTVAAAPISAEKTVVVLVFAAPSRLSLFGFTFTATPLF